MTTTPNRYRIWSLAADGEVTPSFNYKTVADPVTQRSHGPRLVAQAVRRDAGSDAVTLQLQACAEVSGGLLRHHDGTSAWTTVDDSFLQIGTAQQSDYDAQNVLHPGIRYRIRYGSPSRDAVDVLIVSDSNARRD